MKSRIVLMFLGLLILCGVSVLAQEVQTETEGVELAPPTSEPEGGAGTGTRTGTGRELAAGPLSLTATGQVSWLVEYGFGDPQGLTEKGYANQLLLEQGISVDAEGGVHVGWPLSGVLSISAHLDNRKAENLQVLGIEYRGKDLFGEFGDFTIPGDTSFTGYGRKLKGFRIEWTPNGGRPWKVVGIFSRVEGLPQVKVFKGNTSPGEIVYRLRPPDRPWEEMPYLQNIRGLQYYRVEGYVPGFTKLRLAFNASPGLGKLLTGYGLGYLLAEISGSPTKEVEQARYAVITADEEQYLVLKRPALELLRDALQEYIDDYNEEHDLTGDERKRYPLSPGTDYERAFLEALARDYARFDLDGESLALDGYADQRFYFLGHTGIDPESVVVEVKTEEGFKEIGDPSLIGYEYRLFPDKGIIALDFPPSFFADLEGAQVRVRFNYAVSGGMYVLGLSIVRGSEKVYLNGELLQRDVDYTIDYETGALLLFRPVEADDELKIEYEIYRGGLGGYTEYQRGLTGVLVNYEPEGGPRLGFDLLRAADSGGTGDRTGLRVMPNDHIIAGFSGEFHLGGLEAQLELAYNHNKFPFDDNRRRNLPNRINAILALNYHGKEYVLFGHQNGLTVYDADSRRWQSYGSLEGLAGRQVRDIAYDPETEQLAFATDSGVSLLRLEGEDPFAVLPNWRRFYKQDGLASQDVRAVLIAQGMLYVGTDAGLCRVPLADVEEKSSWITYNRENSALPSDEVLHLATDGEAIYVGTAAGLVRFDPEEERFTPVPGLSGEGAKITALIGTDGEVLAATEYGVRAISHGRGSGWLPAPEPEGEGITALAILDGEVWYGTRTGLYRSSAPGEPVIPGAISALGVGAGKGGVLWVGTEAEMEAETDGGYRLSLWRLEGETREEFTTRTTGISGRDEYRFTDIPAREHTDRGWAGVLTLSQPLGENLKLIGRLESLSPRFTTLEGSERRDVKGWSLGAEWSPLPGLSLSLTHEAELLNSELSRLDGSIRPRYTEKEEISLGWGPDLTLGYALERTARRGRGFTEARGDLSLTLRRSLFAGLLDLSLGYDRSDYLDLQWKGHSSQEHRLTLGVRVGKLPGLNLELNYSLPVKVYRYGERRRSWGSEGLDLQASWAAELPIGSLNAEYHLSSYRRLPSRGRGQGLEVDGEGKLALQFKRLQLDQFQLALTPQGALTFKHKGTQLQLVGEGGLRGELRDFKANLSYKLGLSEESRLRLSELQHTLSGQVRYTGWRGLQPSLSGQGSFRFLRHPHYGVKVLENWSLTAGLNWQVSPELKEDLALSRTRVRNENDRENTTSYALRSTTSFSPALLPRLTTSLEALGNYLVGKQRGKGVNTLKVDLALKGDYRLAENWNASGVVGYLFNLDLGPDLDRSHPEARARQGLYLSLQVAMNF